MTDVEVYEPPERVDVGTTIAPVSGHELDVILRQADVLAASDIIPKAYRRAPANIVAAALTGRSFGWDALTAMRNGHVIEGTFSIKPEAMLALVRRAGHSVGGVTGPEQATVTGRRRDTGDEMTVTFSMVDARGAGLANKTVWKQYPASMCWARAVAQLCRMLFPDVTLGLSYTPEELGASVNADGEVVDAEVVALDPPTMSAGNVERIVAACEKWGVPVAEVVLRATNGRAEDPSELYASEVAVTRQALDAVVADWQAPADEIDAPFRAGPGQAANQ